MWDPPPTGYKLIDLTGQSPARSVPQDMMSSPVRRPVPPAHDAAASPTRDHRKMRPLRVSDSGMTAVLAIREHAAVQKQQEQQEQHRHHQHHHQHHHSPLPEIDPSIERQTASQPQAPEGEGHATMHDSFLAGSAQRQYLPPRAELPAGVIALRGSGARIMFFGSREGQDVEAQLHWYKPKKPQEARGKIVCMRREMAGNEYQDLINTRRQLMSIGARAIVVVQAQDSPPVIELPVGDGVEPEVIPFLFVQGKTFERQAKDELDACVMFDAVTAAQDFVAEALTAHNPSLVLLEPEDLKSAFNEHDVPYVLPEVHRKIAKSLSEALQQKIAGINSALASLQHAMSDAQENFAASIEHVEQRVRQSDGRVLFLEHVIQDLQNGRIAGLQEQVQKEKQHSQSLEEQLYKPEVQAVLHAKKRKGRQASVADFFDGGRMKQPGQQPMPMALDKAAYILGHTKPGDLAGQADLLVGAAEELAGSEDAQVIQIQAKLRYKENTKWFNQWYNIVNWRTMSKVIKEGTLPFETPNTKTFRSPDNFQATNKSTGLPAITSRAGNQGVERSEMRPGTGSELSTQHSVAPSTPDSAQVHLKQTQNTVKVQEETLRSFVAEVKALEGDCAHWRTVVDKKHQALKAAQKELEEEKLAHAETKRLAAAQARERDSWVKGMLHELTGMVEVLGEEVSSVKMLQAQEIAAKAGSRGGSRSSSRYTAPPRGSTPMTPGKSRAKTAKPKSVVLSRQEATKIFYEIDADGNGEISQIEYIKALRKNPAIALRLGLPSQIRQEEESRYLFQYMFGEMDKDGTKSISLQEFVEYYSESHAEAQSEVLSIEDDDAAPRKPRLDTGKVKPLYKKKEDSQILGPSGTIGELFKKWSGADGGQKGKKANSVDFKEFTAMLKSLNLKVDRHKAQEIFRQANRRVGDPTPDGDTSEMDWDEFEFAVKKVCEYLKIDPESLLDEEGPRAVAPAENDTKKVFYKKKEGPQAPRPTGPVAQLFNKWSSTKKKGSRGKGVDFKEFCEMLKVLQLKVGKHKAQEIFRQANRRVGDPTPDGDASEMDWDEFEFAVNKVCEYLNIDPSNLVGQGAAGAALAPVAPVANVAGVAKLQQKMRGQAQKAREAVQRTASGASILRTTPQTTYS